MPKIYNDMLKYNIKMKHVKNKIQLKQPAPIKNAFVFNVFDKYFHLYSCCNEFAFNKPKILIYDYLTKYFPLTCILFYKYYLKYCESLLIVTNRTNELEGALYYNIPKIGLLSFMDLYDDANIKKYNDKIKQILGTFDDPNIIYENNLLNNSRINKYSCITCIISSNNKSNSEIRDENFEFHTFKNIVKGLKYLEHNGAFILNIPTQMTELFKQIVYIVLSKFVFVRLIPFHLGGVEDNATSRFLFRKYKGDDNNDLENILKLWEKDKTINNIIETTYTPEFNKMIDKTQINPLGNLYDKFIKKALKHNISIDDLANLTKEQILDLAEKRFRTNLDLNIYLCESVGLQVKEEYKKKSIDYKNQIAFVIVDQQC